MLRDLLTQKDKPVEVLTTGATLKRGAFVYKDAEDDQIKVLASGLGDDLVDICKNYDGENSIIDPNDAAFETIAEGEQAIRIPTLFGEHYATSELTRNYADIGDPMNVTAGKLVKAAGASAYQWVYRGTYSDGTGIAMHEIEKVTPATAPASRTLVYNSNGGTGTLVDARSPYFQGKTAIALENTFVAPAYYTFECWNPAANGSGTDVDPGDEVTIGASNITLYAQWQATYSGIIYDENGGSGELVDDNLYEEDDVATVLDNEFTPPSGYIFSGWNTEADGTGTSYSAEDEITILEANLGTPITLYAIWVDDEDTFRLEYDANTGEGEMVDPNSPYEADETAVLLANDFTPPEGKIFFGWNSLANGTGDPHAPEEEFAIAADTKLYAQWVDAFTVTYDPNGGTGSMADENSPYPTGSDVTVLMNAFTPPTGKAFAGWNTNAEGTGDNHYPNDIIEGIAADITLYPKWIDTFTLSYNANGGIGSQVDPNSPYLDGASATVMHSGFLAPEGKVFSVFNTQADGLGDAYAPGGPLLMLANTTLYAIWVDDV
jgi:uncharacterized repeat protein (TIGR02543 family)